MSTDSLSMAAPARRSVGRSRRDILWALIWVAMAAAAVYFLLPQVGELQASLGAEWDAFKKAWNK